MSEIQVKIIYHLMKVFIIIFLKKIIKKLPVKLNRKSSNVLSNNFKGSGSRIASFIIKLKFSSKK